MIRESNTLTWQETAEQKKMMRHARMKAEDFLVLKVARIEPFHRYDQILLRSLGKARASYSFTNIH